MSIELVCGDTAPLGCTVSFLVSGLSVGQEYRVAFAAPTETDPDRFECTLEFLPDANGKKVLGFTSALGFSGGVGYGDVDACAINRATDSVGINISGSGSCPDPFQEPVLDSAIAGDATVDLSWTDAEWCSGGGIAGDMTYKIYRGLSAGSVVQIAAGIVGTTYHDTGLTNGTTYYYKVSAVYDIGGDGISSQMFGSGLSNALSATPTGGTFAPALRSRIPLS